MHREIRLACILIVAFSASVAVAQQPSDKCAQAKYSDRRANAHRYRLKAIEGQAVYGEPTDRGELSPATGLCVALFNRKNKQLVAGVPTDGGGQFKFATVAPGEYVLIVSVSELHEINIPVAVADDRTVKHWGLLLHLRSREDRKKSFVTPITQPGLRAELLKLVVEDRDIRNQIIKNGSNVHDLNQQALDARMAGIDAGNTARIKAIVKRYGWPGPELIGQDGAGAAFLLVQHSPDLAFQQAMLPLVRRSFANGKLSASDYALLQDRVLMLSGKPQWYGMALKPWTGREPELYPIEDEANVDKRRAKIGLPPLREYLEFMKRLYFPQQ